MFKKLRNTLIALTMTLALVSCGGKEQAAKNASSGAPKDELVFVNFRDIRDLNPHLYAGEMYAQELVFETLIVPGKDGAYEPCLAESYTVSDDGLTYTFKMRPGVVFTDGEKCDAYAIKANFDAIIDNAGRHPWTWLKYLDKVEAVDADTFVIKLTTAYYPMLTEIAVTRPFAIVSPKVMKDGKTKNGLTAFIGTGPYKLGEYVTDQYAVFERNEAYWGPKPALRKITVKVISDNQTRVLALEKGEIDIIFGKNMIDADTILKFQKNPNFTVAMSVPTSTREIVLNSTNEILADVNVRRALQHATSKKAISEGIFYGLEPGADFAYAETTPYCNVGLTPYEYDVAKAESMLDAAGWVKGADGVRTKDGKKMELNLLYNSDSVTEKTISEYLQSEFAKIGLVLHIAGQEEQSYRDNMKAGHFDMIFNIVWGSPYDPQASLAGIRQPVYGDYAAQLGLPNKNEIDENITKAITSTNIDERRELYKKILTALHEQAAYLPLTYECNKTIYRKDLQGVHFAESQYEIPFWDMHF